MIKNRSFSVLLSLFLGISCHHAQGISFAQFFADMMQTLFYGTPPRTISNNAQNNARQAHAPTQFEIAQQRIQNSFGLLPVETEEEFITIVNNSANLVNGLSDCVQRYAFDTALRSLNVIAAQQVSESMAGNARAQMTQHPQNFDLKPMIYENLTVAIINKHNEINSRY